MLRNINSEYYAYSLDSNLANVMDSMATKIEQLHLDSSFKSQKKPTDTSVESHMINYTNLSLTQETVDDALIEFTNETGIPAVIVVDTMENVFGKSIPMSDIFTVVVLLGLAVVAIVIIIKTVKKNKENDNDPKNDNNRYNQNPGGYQSSYH